MGLIEEALEVVAEGRSRPGLPCSFCRLLAHVDAETADQLTQLLHASGAQFSDAEMMVLLRRHPDWPPVGFQQLGVHRRGKCGGKAGV